MIENPRTAVPSARANYRSVATREKSRPRILGVLARNSLWVVLTLLVAIMAIVSPSFRDPLNLQNILSQNAIIGVAACGMLIIMISGNFDLSMGASGGAVTVVTAATSAQLGTGTAMLIGIALGVVVGVVNGLIVTKLGINSFIATFALASIITGILFVETQAQSAVGNTGFLATVAYGHIWVVPTLFVAFLFFAALTHMVLRFTKWGHWTYAVGSNSDASFLSGVPVTAIKIGAFVFGGLAVGVAGALLFGQTGIGQAASATNWPLQAIAICVIGGTSLFGGIGRVSNTIAAVLVLGVVANALNQLAVSPYWQPAVTGFIILLAVVLDRVSRRPERAG